MIFMTVLALVDTNILVYRFDPSFPGKQRIATALLRDGIQHDTVRLPHQAIIEFVAATTRPLAGGQSLLTPDAARHEAEEFLIQFEVLYPTAVLLAYLGDSHRFDHAKQVAAFAGLSPAERQSGTYKGQTRLSKTGDAFLRKALYLPAVVASRHHPIVRAFCDRLKAKGKAGNVIVGAAMRKLLTLAYGVLKSAPPFDPKWALAN